MMTTQELLLIEAIKKERRYSDAAKNIIVFLLHKLGGVVTIQDEEMRAVLDDVDGWDHVEGQHQILVKLTLKNRLTPNNRITNKP